MRLQLCAAAAKIAVCRDSGLTTDETFPIDLMTVQAQARPDSTHLKPVSRECGSQPTAAGKREGYFVNCRLTGTGLLR